MSEHMDIEWFDFDEVRGDKIINGDVPSTLNLLRVLQLLSSN